MFAGMNITPLKATLTKALRPKLHLKPLPKIGLARCVEWINQIFLKHK
jgi:hypothetical protein